MDSSIHERLSVVLESPRLALAYRLGRDHAIELIQKYNRMPTLLGMLSFYHDYETMDEVCKEAYALGRLVVVSQAIEASKAEKARKEAEHQQMIEEMHNEKREDDIAQVMNRSDENFRNFIYDMYKGKR